MRKGYRIIIVEDDDLGEIIIMRRDCFKKFPKSIRIHREGSGKESISFGIDTIRGTKVVDTKKVIRSISEGASFKEVTGLKLVTLTK